MGLPPNQTGRKHPNRKSAINTPIPDAIAPRTAQELLEELIALTKPDIKQIRKAIHHLFPGERKQLLDNIALIRNAVYEIKYDQEKRSK